MKNLIRLATASLVIFGLMMLSMSFAEGDCDQCVVTRKGKIKFSCKVDPEFDCSTSSGGTTLSCDGAKECVIEPPA